MLNYKIMLASFALVFLAELGDKTQLTALAFSASSRSPASVFLGTSLALICTTALAVFLGEFLSRHLPQNLIIIASAVGFILVGVILLVNIARRAPEKTSGAPSAPPDSSRRASASTVPAGTDGGAAPAPLLARTVLRQAMAFEEDSIRALAQAADSMPPGPIQRELRQIAAEEKEHGTRLAQLSGAGPGNDQVFASAPRHMPEPPRIAADSALPAGTPEDAETPEIRRLLSELVRAEEGAAAFYLSLSRLALIPSVRSAFRRLAEEELTHVDRLHDLLENRGPSEA